jgi:hypothetical protein
MTNWEEFCEQLVENLGQIPAPKEIKTEGEFNTAVSTLIQTLQDTIKEKVPVSKPVPHS